MHWFIIDVISFQAAEKLLHPFVVIVVLERRNLTLTVKQQRNFRAYMELGCEGDLVSIHVKCS